jgi:hypothetical protein
MDQRVTKTMPAKSRRSLGKIADDIVCELGDVEAKSLVLPEDETRAKVLRAIGDSTEFFHRSGKTLSRKGRTAIAKDAQKLTGLITAIESELKRLPDPIAAYLFGPPIARLGPTIGRRHTVMPVDEILAATLTDRAALMDRLGRLRRDCERQQSPERPPGPEHDRPKYHCAVLASNLMKTYSRQQITSTDVGSYRFISSLVYEALTGQPNVDLKRMCDCALREDRELQERLARIRLIRLIAFGIPIPRPQGTG